MTESEWQEIVQIVTETASQTARECIASAYRKELPAPPTKSTINQQQIEIVRNGLERYRESQPDSAIRKVIDQLMRLHANTVNPSDRYYRTRHNILVLKYIVSQTMSDKEIRKRLGMGTKGQGFESQLEKGIQEIASLFFWDWDIQNMQNIF